MLRKLLAQVATKALPAIEIAARQMVISHVHAIAAMDAAARKRARRLERNRKANQGAKHG